MNAVRHLLVALACIWACHAAQADTSRLGDETDVAEAGDCDVETIFERRRARGAAPEREASIQLACGIGWQTELAAAFARRRSDGARDQAIGLEAKAALGERSIGGIGWTLVAAIGAERAGGPWRRSEHFIGVEASYQPASAWLIEAKLGSARDRVARNDSTLWALAVEHALTEAVEARAEAEGEDRGRPLVSIGLRYAFWPETALVNLSYGVRTGPLRERRLAIGVKFEF